MAASWLCGPCSAFCRAPAADDRGDGLLFYHPDAEPDRRPVEQLRLSDLRPTAVRSFMERRLTMASTPIIRYYDHLRFVYEVESTNAAVAPVSSEAQDDDSGSRRATRRRPGESNRRPVTKTAAPAWIPRSSPVNPARNDSYDFLETSLTFRLPDFSRPGPRTPAAPLGSTGKEHNMDCVNHVASARPPIARTAARHSARAARATQPEGRFFAHPAWRHGRAISSRCRLPPSGPNPSAAAVLGLIPGVGAMYNGQFLKGLSMSSSSQC